MSSPRYHAMMFRCDMVLNIHKLLIYMNYSDELFRVLIMVF